MVCCLSRSSRLKEVEGTNFEILTSFLSSLSACPMSGASKNRDSFFSLFFLFLIVSFYSYPNLLCIMYVPFSH